MPYIESIAQKDSNLRSVVIAIGLPSKVISDSEAQHM